MDNVTHAFAGAVIADCALPRDASPVARLVCVATGIVAANAPDLDLVYTGITARPLGYLLHHRGHTHTVPGLLALGVCLVAALHAWPAARQVIAAARARIAAIAAAGLLSHLLLDATNSYGTHVFYPVSSGWVYGDSVFVLEPWLWLSLGTAVALNARRVPWRVCTWALTVLPIAGLAYVRLVPPVLVAALAIAGAAMIAGLRPRTPRQRAVASLVASAGVVAVFFVSSQMARAAVTRHLEASPAIRPVDLLLNPNPGTPWCWSAMALEHDPETDELVTRRGSLSLAPRLWPVSSCASHRVLGPRTASTTRTAQDLAWEETWRMPLAELQRLEATDCRVRAWLQFGRFPHVEAGRIVDLRFENPLQGNFTAMAMASDAGACPERVTRWTAPRSDVIGR